MTGSDKQVAWATDIRTKCLRDWDTTFTPATIAAGTEADFAAMREWVATHADARWWIDRRASGPIHLAREAVKALQLA